MTAIGFVLLVIGVLIGYWSYKNREHPNQYVGLDLLSVLLSLFGIVLLTAGIAIRLWQVMP